MQRSCAQCTKPFEAQRPTAKFCGGTCRKRAQRVGRGVPPVPASIANAQVGDLVSAVQAELVAAGRENSSLGMQAVRLARRMGEFDTGSSLAALSKELRGVMGEALANVEVAADPLDELQVKRDAKRRRAAG